MALHLRVVAERGVVDWIGDLAEESQRSAGGECRLEPAGTVPARGRQRPGQPEGRKDEGRAGVRDHVLLTLVAIDEPAVVESLRDQVERRIHPVGDGLEPAQECRLGERGIGTSAVDAELQRAGRAEVGRRGRACPPPCGCVAGHEPLIGERSRALEAAHRGDQGVRVACRHATDLPDTVVGLAPVLDEPSGENRHG